MNNKRKMKKKKSMQKEKNEVPVDWQVFSCDIAVVTVSVAASLTACSSLCRRIRTHLQRASVSSNSEKTKRNSNHLGCNHQTGTNTAPTPWWRRAALNEQ
jgi:hypothetical protein